MIFDRLQEQNVLGTYMLTKYVYIRKYVASVDPKERKKGDHGAVDTYRQPVGFLPYLPYRSTVPICVVSIGPVYMSVATVV